MILPVHGGAERRNQSGRRCDAGWRLLILAAMACIAIMLCSCSTTGLMLPDETELSDGLTLGEQLERAGLKKIMMTRPAVYYDGQEWAAEFLRMIEEAEHYIIVTVFLGSQCDENQAIVDALESKARSGIPVYLVYDGTGTFDMTESRFHLRPLSDLADSGVHLLEYHPFSMTRLVNLWHVIQREHRKFIVVDGSEIAVGGMNLNYISLGALDGGGQRDSMYRFRSADAGAALLRGFVDFWNSQSWDEISIGDFKAAVRTDEESLEGYLADQRDGHPIMARMFGTLINSAENQILSLPFLPYSDKNMLSVLGAAAQRGVDFKMIVPFDSRPMPRKATSWMLSALVKTGIEVRMENPGLEKRGLLHEKLMVIDGRYVCFGSSNFNYRSMNLSNEIMIVLEDEQFAAEAVEHYNLYLDDTYVIEQDEADSLRKLVYLPNFLFGFFGG